MPSTNANVEPKLVLELAGVSKRYGETTALESINLILHASRTYVLLGTSGCGKSTLLKAALGLVTPDTGTVQFEGAPIHNDNVQQLRQRIGYVIQRGGLFPHLTAKENVSLVGRHLRWDRQRIETRMGELAELTRLPRPALDRYPAHLSGGQQQRVGLMRALFLDPDLLLLDEPLGALDPITRSELQADLRGIFRKLAKTVVIVTHDLHEAAYFADEILLLKSGQIVQRGPLRDLIDSPADPFVSRFINAQRTSLTGDGPWYE